MLYIPHICFIMSLASCWFSKKIALIFYVGAIAAGLFVGALQPLALLTIPVLFGSLYVIQGRYNKALTALAHIAFTTLSFFLFFHFVPGISNFKIFDAVFVSERCAPFTMYLNMENEIIAFLLMYMIVPTSCARTEWKQVFVSAGIYGSICIVSLMAAALATGFVKFNPKFPPQTFWFLVNNLMLVCIVQEAFFRGYIQKHLTAWCEAHQISEMFALVAASIIFGLCHYQSGVVMVILSTIAGLFYGAAYMRNNRIEAAILVHFALNAAHFFFFSYPSFAR
ncbi:MAG: CPBP family intramembrane metalloprotease [Alphaproteobacteria bacterium]|nr:CPBP family intramembrane metalloprotease [Alphaproteobacteria bacterium]